MLRLRLRRGRPDGTRELSDVQGRHVGASASAEEAEDLSGCPRPRSQTRSPSTIRCVAGAPTSFSERATRPGCPGVEPSARHRPPPRGRPAPPRLLPRDRDPHPLLDQAEARARPVDGSPGSRQPPRLPSSDGCGTGGLCLIGAVRPRRGTTGRPRAPASRGGGGGSRCSFSSPRRCSQGSAGPRSAPPQKTAVPARPAAPTPAPAPKAAPAAGTLFRPLTARTSRPARTRPCSPARC